jgi:hypothetical protein
VSLSCGVDTDKGTDLSPTGEPSPTSTSVFDSAPVRGYSFAEAERLAGFRIPRSNLYPIAYANAETYLQWIDERERPISETQYTYPPDAPSSIGVVVGPAYYWGGDDTWTANTPAIVGGRDGWLSAGDSARSFAFKCGAVEDETVWCVIRAPSVVTDSDLDQFVASVN